LCEERKIAFLFVPSKLDLGRSAGIDVGCAAISVLEGGEGSKSLNEIIDATEQIRKGGVKVQQ
jgi:large subunit ribosomal protein L7Ae